MCKLAEGVAIQFFASGAELAMLLMQVAKWADYPAALDVDASGKPDLQKAHALCFPCCRDPARFAHPPFLALREDVLEYPKSAHCLYDISKQLPTCRALLLDMSCIHVGINAAI